jgi:hypothetical protein
MFRRTTTHQYHLGQRVATPDPRNPFKGDEESAICARIDCLLAYDDAKEVSTRDSGLP